MSTPRFHIPVPLRFGHAEPAEAAAHHAARVLRLRNGDAVTLFNGQGGEYAARITAIGKHDVTVAIERHDPVERESPLPVTLCRPFRPASAWISPFKRPWSWAWRASCRWKRALRGAPEGRTRRETRGNTGSRW